MSRTVFVSLVLHAIAFVCLDFAVGGKRAETIEIENLAWVDRPARAPRSEIARAGRRSQAAPEAAKAIPSSENSAPGRLAPGRLAKEARHPATAPDLAGAGSGAETEDTGEADLEALPGGRPPLNETERYLAYIRDAIAVRQAYPAPSRALGEQGAVRLRMIVAKSGVVEKVELLEASAFKRLNDAAVRAVTKAAPFKPFPAEMAAQTWRITLPIRFALASP